MRILTRMVQTFLARQREGARDRVLRLDELAAQAVFPRNVRVERDEPTPIAETLEERNGPVHRCNDGRAVDRLNMRAHQTCDDLRRTFRVDAFQSSFGPTAALDAALRRSP